MSRKGLAKFLAEKFGLDYEKVWLEILKYQRSPRVAVVGSRNFVDEKFVFRALDKKLPLGTNYIISGEATGVDTIAKKYAEIRGLRYIPFPYEKKYGKAGGPIRNTKIVATATCVIAFPGPKSTGTWDTIRKSRAKGVDVMVIKVDA